LLILIKVVPRSLMYAPVPTRWLAMRCNSPRAKTVLPADNLESCPIDRIRIRISVGIIPFSCLCAYPRSGLTDIISGAPSTHGDQFLRPIRHGLLLFPGIAPWYC